MNQETPIEPTQAPATVPAQASTIKKIGIWVVAVALILVGMRFGIIPALIAAALAGIMLKKTGVVAANSAWVNETKGTKIAKYVLLGLFVALILFAAVALYMNS